MAWPPVSRSRPAPPGPAGRRKRSPWASPAPAARPLAKAARLRSTSLGLAVNPSLTIFFTTPLSRPSRAVITPRATTPAALADPASSARAARLRGAARGWSVFSWARTRESSLRAGPSRSRASGDWATRMSTRRETPFKGFSARRRCEKFRPPRMRDSASVWPKAKSPLLVIALASISVVVCMPCPAAPAILTLTSIFPPDSLLKKKKRPSFISTPTCLLEQVRSRPPSFRTKRPWPATPRSAGRRNYRRP